MNVRYYSTPKTRTCLSHALRLLDLAFQWSRAEVGPRGIGIDNQAAELVVANLSVPVEIDHRNHHVYLPRHPENGVDSGYHMRR